MPPKKIKKSNDHNSKIKQKDLTEYFQIQISKNSAGAMASTSLDRSNDINNTYIDSESVLCNVEPNTLKEIQFVSKDESLYTSASSDQQCISEDYEVYSLSNLDTMGSENLNSLNDNSRNTETDNTEQMKMEYEQIVCDVDPNYVNGIQSESAQSQEKEEKKRGVKKVSNSLFTDSFILHTIYEYDRHLKTSRQTFKGILTDESLDLLSTLTQESEDIIKLVSYLFCVDHWEPKDKAGVDFPKINYDFSLLNERGLITFTPKDADNLSFEVCMDLLPLSQTEETCQVYLNITSLKSKTQNKKKREIIQVYDRRDIVDSSSNNKSELLNELRSKVKKWKLSDLARETITELTILMHLNIFENDCEISSTQAYNDRPMVKFNPSSNTKFYPVVEEMILDNATIIFQDRKAFCAYLNALALSKKYKTVQNKHEFVLGIYQLYKDVNEENMSHYIALPVWLRRFTPIHFYLEILADCVLKHLKKAKEYQIALNILDLLIAQVACMQNSKAKWYDRKALIQITHLKSHGKATSTLCEAFNAGLQEETIMILQRRAKHILDCKTRFEVTQKDLNILQVNADSLILERNIPDPDHYQSKRNELKSEIICCNIYKNNGRATLAEHWEGDLMKAIYLMLFWDIIFTKPLGIQGIFLSHYQQYPLDMWCENFYINRKAKIDDFLIKIKNCSNDDIKKIIADRYDEYKEYKLSHNKTTHKKFNNDDIMLVVDCLGGRRLASICRRLAQNYNYMRNGFPDLTLCNTKNYTIEFREVKTKYDTAKEDQLQWLHYLIEHDIKAGFCYLNYDEEEKDNMQKTANESDIDSSHSTINTNVEDVQPGPSSASFNETGIGDTILID